MDEQEYFYCKGGRGVCFGCMEKPPRKKYDNFISVRVDDALYDIIVKLAENEDRPVGTMTRILLKEAAHAREAAGKRKKA